KAFNDTYGHETGDEVLRHAAAICQREMKPDMLFARYGGEEFVVALQGGLPESADLIAERLRIALSGTALDSSAHGRLIVTASFGIASSYDSTASLETLLREADAALYEAKRDGRNRVC